MSERTLDDYTLAGMKPFWSKPVKHADGFTAGIADLSAWLMPAGNIWIECKALDKWPARSRTPVKFGLDDLQKDFLLERRGWLWCRVRREYLLFNHNSAFWLIDTPDATQEVVRSWAHKIWNNSVNWKEFALCVGQRYE